MRLTESELAALQKKRGVAAAKAPLNPAKKRKYSNVKTEYDGQVFDSKAEMKRYQELVLLRTARKIKWFIRQVSFPLPGGIVYRADFLIVEKDPLVWADKITVEDVTGIMTQVKENKLKQIKAIYGFDVVVVQA